jgi:hypothetical protein
MRAGSVLHYGISLTLRACYSKVHAPVRRYDLRRAHASQEDSERRVISCHGGADGWR